MASAVTAYYSCTSENLNSADPHNHSLSSIGDEGVAPPITVEYLAEGAANVIWSLSTDPAVKQKLLRLRKGTWSGDAESQKAPAQRPPPFLTSMQVLDFYTSSIRPLFKPGQLVEQELVHIDHQLVAQCNTRLDELEHAHLRPVGRHHWHIKHEEAHGLLITSMLPSSQKSALFHFKPKWLAQSPTAPPKSRRCRTCALAARRDTAVDRLICPLALYSGDPVLVRQQIEARIRSEATMSQDMVGRRPSITTGDLDEASQVLKVNTIETLIEHFAELFQPGREAHKLLERLKELQLQYDPAGVLNLESGADTSNISMAMTLRDATMFVKFTGDGADVRLGDLDPKSGDSDRKVQEWRSTEEKLINEGWYTGMEDQTSKHGLEQHTYCFLWNA